MTIIGTPTHALTFGSLNLIGLSTDIATFGYTFDALGDNADWGNPVPIEQKVISWLQDGAIVALMGYDNRELYVRVTVTAASDLGLAAGESALMLETGKPNLFIWTPPGPSAKPSVFSVVISHLEQITDDFQELNYERTYGLRITAEPFVRSSTAVQVSQVAPAGGGPTVTSIDACTATTNWTGTPNAPTTSGGAVKETKATSPGGTVGTLTLTRSSLAVNMASSAYLRVDWGMTSAGDPATRTRQVVVNGPGAPVQLVEVAGSGNVRWYDYAGSAAGGTTLTSVKLSLTNPFIVPGAGINSVLFVNDISRTTALVDPGSTNRQLSRVLQVAGSARTQGSLAVEDAAAALGTALVYTCPAVDGLMQPSLRSLLFPGPTPTPDATTVSGTTSPLDTPHSFLVPISGLQPGGHLLLARVKHASSGARTVQWQAGTYQGAPLALVGDNLIGTTAFTSVAGAWQVVTLASLNLPVTKVGSAGMVGLVLTASAGVVLDEAWIFNIETGRLTWVECGTASPAGGGSSNRLWLDAPTVDSPVPAVYRGFASDRSDSAHASSEMKSFGNHEILPPAMTVFTVTSNSTASTVTLTHYPRYHTHAVA